MSALQIASFQVDGRLYGFNILQIREVMFNPEYSPVPQAPPIVEGLMNLRGQIVTVVDLARSIGSSGDRERQTCIILKTDDDLDTHGLTGPWIERAGSDTVGLLVDDMGEVVEIDDGEIDASPANVSEEGAGYVKGVAKLDGALVTLLSLDRILSF